MQLYLYWKKGLSAIRVSIDLKKRHSRIQNERKLKRKDFFSKRKELFFNIDSLDDYQLLQNGLNALVDWSSTWELKFHPSKCQVISVTRKRNPFNFDYFMNNTRLSSVKPIKDLGIEISSKLDWNTHINNVVKKCNRKLGLIKHPLGFNVHVNVTKALYLALIRSDLEFGSCLWNGTWYPQTQYWVPGRCPEASYQLQYALSWSGLSGALVSIEFAPSDITQGTAWPFVVL